MQGEYVELNDMLACRERRVKIQQSLIQQYRTPVISFCMNIPGPIKTNPLIRKAFDQGSQEIRKLLCEHHIPILESIQIHERTGDEWFLAAKGDAALLKELSQSVEDSHPLGRLFDIDVIDTEGSKLSRKNRRLCIICQGPAQECARSRKHSTKELEEKVIDLLLKYI